MEPSSVPETPKEEYRSTILKRLNARNLAAGPLIQIFTAYSELADQLVQSNRLRLGTVSAHQSDSAQILALQEKLADLYRKKEQNDQQLIETRNLLSDLQKDRSAQLIIKEETQRENAKLRKELQASLEEQKVLKESNEHIKDEYFALQACYNNLKDKCRQVEEERNSLVERLKALKEKQIEMFNRQNEIEEEMLRKKLSCEIESAISTRLPDMTLGSTDDRYAGTDSASGEYSKDCLPNNCIARWDNHDGEVNDVAWNISGDWFATGGGDRKLRVFEGIGGCYERRFVLTGCNGAITRIDFDLEQPFLLASSTDHTVRIWGLSDQRLKHTLTGHTDKVSSAKFYRNSHVISGSHDRTIRLWDIYSRKCAKTFFPGSTILDIASNDKRGAIISGHFDKKVRIWDVRSDDPVAVLEFGGRVTSLDLSLDQIYLLCSSRDETLSLLDLRNNQIVHIFSAEQYRTSSDYSRCVLSPGLNYCAAGSADGHVFIWNVHSTKLERILSRGGHE
ncbi:hypothetical protein AB6A40_002150 [Gnathostoma spinigerum]|uniref:Autophagy-related protein 16 domain-containing protein n=1 Tax=Gnathostoma spinigerum TaxID=75299 RepID=A0ABD6E758_9BILA